MNIVYNCECGQRLSAPETAAGRRARCPACGRVSTVPAASGGAAEPGVKGPVAATGSELVGQTCLVCRTAIAHGDDACLCSECRSPYHRECWNEIGGCATYGCELMPKAPKVEPGGEGVQGWGDEKACPRCGKAIRSVALKCRFCKARFPSTIPMTSAEYRAWWDTEAKLGPVRQHSILAFVLSLFGVLAPVLVFVVGAWVWRSRSLLRRVGPPHEILAYGALILCVFYSICILVFVLW